MDKIVSDLANKHGFSVRPFEMRGVYYLPEKTATGKYKQKRYKMEGFSSQDNLRASDFRLLKKELDNTLISLFSVGSDDFGRGDPCWLWPVRNVVNFWGILFVTKTNLPASVVTDDFYRNFRIKDFSFIAE